MAAKIIDEDLRIVEEIAKKYNMSLTEFCNVVALQSRKPRSRVERQFRASEAEKNMITTKAKSCGLSVARYCELACSSLLSSEEMSEIFYDKLFDISIYGANRTKHISVTFKDSATESNLLKIAEQFNIEIGALIRFCALNYNRGK